ncbi:septation regulator SpoVG [Ruminococcus sp. NK3A76]|uniref:septation regulator SpoVG n=1 Tax=Ruminococcus sp. NK3A76 TaxID=877411 RepID=UPI000492202F|nr:septation regulator SpoVG [Ruminococcus sp. NK3A76]
MTITDIKVRKLLEQGKLKAIVSITIDGMIAIHDIKVIEGSSRLFVAMPSRKDDSGVYRDIAHPISFGARADLEQKILAAYYKAVQQSMSS